MPTSNKTSKPLSPETSVDAIAVLLNPNNEAIGAYMEATQTMLRGVAAFNAELLSFATTRFQKSVELSQSIAECSGPHEAFQLQCECGRSETEQYFDEATKMMNMAAEVARDSWAPIQSQASSALEGIVQRPTGPES